MYKKTKLFFSIMLSATLLLVACQAKDTAPAVAEDVSTEAHVTEETASETEETSSVPENIPPAAASADLSGDLYSFQISIDGTLYQFPMSYNDFTSYGWEYDGDLSQTLDPNQYAVSEVFKKGDYKVYTKICNFGSDVVSLDQCIIGSISFDNYQIKDNSCGITLPQNIRYMTSTKEDIIAAYGDPTDLYEGEMSTSLTYKYDSYQQVRLNVDPEANLLIGIDIENLIPIDSAASADSETSKADDEIPEIVSQYDAPSKLSDDFFQYTVELDGALYTLPAPVSIFEENGWKIIEDTSDGIVKAQDYERITIMKNNQKMCVSIRNYAQKATSSANTFVTSVFAGESEPKLPIKVAKNIEIGTKEADVKKALNGLTYKEEDSTTLYFYELNDPNSVLDGTTITINKESGAVSKLEVKHDPKLKDLFQ